MTKELLIKIIARATGRSQALVDEILTTGLHVMGQAAAQGHTVRWPGLGTLDAVARPERLYHHPGTRQMTVKPACNELRFRAAGALKKAANPPKPGPKPKPQKP